MNEEDMIGNEVRKISRYSEDWFPGYDKNFGFCQKCNGNSSENFKQATDLKCLTVNML